MAKEIAYKALVNEINHGTEENPEIGQVIEDNFFICPTQESYDKMLPIAERYAIPGTINVSGEFDPDSEPKPSTEELEDENEDIHNAL